MIKFFKFLLSMLEVDPRFIAQGRDRWSGIVQTDSPNCISGPYGVYDLMKHRTTGPLFIERIAAERHACALNSVEA